MKHSLEVNGIRKRDSIWSRRRPMLLLGLVLGLVIVPLAQALITLLVSVLAPAVGVGLFRRAVEHWTQHGGPAALITQVVLTAVILAGIATAAAVASGFGLCLPSVKRARRLGDYRILRRLDSGGVGDVFLAQHARMCRPAAIKVLRASEASDPSGLARFEREIQLASDLTHPNTIEILDYGRERENTFFYAMEYLAGMNIQNLVDRFGPLASERCIHILMQVCGSLSEAHARRIVHRDVKPGNIFLTDRGGMYDFVKVLDFGMSKKMGSRADPTLTQPGIVFGTPSYIAPESVLKPESVDVRADIYGLGAAAYFMLTGRPPFASTSVIEVLADHIRSVPTPPSRVAELPIAPELERIVLRCLEKNPDDRFRDAGELRAALRRISLDEPWTGEKAAEWWTIHVGREDLEAFGRMGSRKRIRAA